MCCSLLAFLVYFLLCVACCLVFAVRCMLFVVCSVPVVVRCVLFVVCCVLLVVFLLFVGCMRGANSCWPFAFIRANAWICLGRSGGGA